MKFTKETFRKMLRTFVQTIIGYIAVNLAIVDFTADKEVVKSALIGLAISAVSAGMSAIMNLQKTENTEEMGEGAMTYDEFVKSYIGKATDIDGSSGVQCVDLAKMFIKYVLGVTPQSIGHAHSYYDNFENTYLKKHFTKIPYKVGVKAQKGDLVVWGIKYNGKSEYGHIAIATGENTAKTVTTYDQNWSGKAMKKVEHSVTGILGFLRPKDQSNIVTKAVTQPTAKYFAKYTGKSASIVDALTAINAKSTFAYRKKIANANGIKTYLGTAKQNTKLLELLKKGKLIKP